MDAGNRQLFMLEQHLYLCCPTCISSKRLDFMKAGITPLMALWFVRLNRGSYKGTNIVIWA
jgi:hypothetical protein